MWDNNAPLQLLKTMPSRLNQENLEKIQLLIDADKYKNSIISGFDLCGIFAPFCRGCDKTSIYPCAVSYIRMLQSQGMNIEIDASPMGMYEPQRYTPHIEIPQTKPVVQAPVSSSRPTTYERKPPRQSQRYEKYFEQRSSERRSEKYSEKRPSERTNEKYFEQRPSERVSEKYSEPKAVEPKVAAKPTEPVIPENVAAEVAATRLENAADIIASIPVTEEIKVEEKNNNQVEEAAAQSKAYEESTATVAEEEQAKQETPAVPENTEVVHEQAKRKLRIAVARRKL